MSLSHLPDWYIIEECNRLENRVYHFEHHIPIIAIYDSELESRQPPAGYPEYDATGQAITSEVIGYTKSGEEIWS